MSTPTGRLVVIKSVCYQSAGREPIAPEARYGRSVQTGEQPWVRWFKVGPEWRPLETGWLKAASSLALVNRGVMPAVQPTPEERAAADALVIEVGVEADGGPRDMHSPPKSPPKAFQVVRPGGMAEFEPADLSALRVRCPAGEADAALYLFPV